MLISGRVLFPICHLHDTLGLLPASHSRNPTRYSHIVGFSSHFYAHFGTGPKVLHPHMSKLMWV
ncbi:MAG: hypothetical protein ACI4E2_03260 [Acetatifactor sp.]